MAKKAKSKAKRAATRLPTYMQDIAFSKRGKKAEAKHRERKLGTFGAASKVRRIDPASVEVQS